MTSLATKVRWGDENSAPKIYLDFSYEKKREGSTQLYRIGVSCRPLISSSSFFGYPIYVRISLDGTEKTTFTLKGTTPNYWSSAISATTGWLAVSNKTSGTTALKIKVYSGSGSTRSTTYNYTLAIDPSASSISVTTANIGSSPTITITKASSLFTHTVQYAFGTLTGTIVEKTDATTISNWTIPDSFYSQIPSAKTGVGSLTCYSYSGDTLIGSSSCQLTVTTNEALCKPIVTGTVRDMNDATYTLTKDRSIIVRYFSTALCAMNVTAQNNATISDKVVNNTSVSNNTLTIANAETNVFTFYAKDSRGYYNTDTKVLTLIPYEKLTANVSAQRTEPASGSATLTISGNYYSGSFGAEDNTITVKYKQDGGDYIEVTPTVSGNKYSITVPIADADYTRAISFDVVVADKLSSITKTETLQRGVPVFDWGENDFNFNVPVHIGGVELVEYIIAALKERGML